MEYKKEKKDRVTLSDKRRFVVKVPVSLDDLKSLEVSFVNEKVLIEIDFKMLTSRSPTRAITMNDEPYVIPTFSFFAFFSFLFFSFSQN